MEDLQLFPMWKQAVIDFVSGNPKPGDIITEEWKNSHFGIYPPPFGTADVFKEYNLKMLAAFDSFQAALLEEYQIHLKSDRKGGHIVLAPNEQTRIAVEDCNTGIKKALKKSKVKLDNVATEALSSDERKEHTDAQVRMSMLAAMHKKVKRLLL